MKVRLKWTGEEIVALRDWARLTQAELAEAMRTNAAVVSRWEHGHVAPSARSKRKLDEIADAAGFEG